MRVRWYVWLIVVLFLLFLFLSSAILFLRNKSSSDAFARYIPYAGTIYEQPIEHILASTASSNRLSMSIYAPVPSSAHTFAHTISLPLSHGASGARSGEARHLVKNLPDPQKQGNEESFLNKLTTSPWIYLAFIFFFVVPLLFMTRLYQKKTRLYQKNEQEIKQIETRNSSVEEVSNTFTEKLYTLRKENTAISDKIADMNETNQRLSKEIVELNRQIQLLKKDMQTIQGSQLRGGPDAEHLTSSNGASSEERSHLEQELKRLLINDITGVQFSTLPNSAPVDLQNWVTHIIPIKTTRRGGSITLSQKYDPVELIYQFQRKLEYEQRTGFSIKNDGQKLKLPTTSNKYTYFLIAGASAADNTLLLQSLTLKVLDKQVCYNIQSGQPEQTLDLALYIHLSTYLKSTTTDAQAEDLISYGISQLMQRLKQMNQTRGQETQPFSIDEIEEGKITAYFEECVQAGQVVLLLDGLEVFNEQPHNMSVETSESSVYSAINKVIKKHPALPIIITTHNSTTQAAQGLEQFSQWKTVQLCADDIRRFIEQKIPDRGNEFNLWLERSPRVQALLTSPLLLEGVIRAHSNNQRWQAGDIYETCKKLLLQKCNDHFSELPQELKTELQKLLDRIDSRFEEAVERLLGSIAWYLHTNNLYEGGKEGVVKAIVDELYTREIQTGQNEIKDILLELFEKKIELFLRLMQQSGLLNEVESGFLCFSCFTWQEYFTAKSILVFGKDGRTSITNWERETKLFTHYHDPWWEEIILIYIRLANEDASIKNLLKALPYTPGEGYNYVLRKNYKEDNNFYNRLFFAAKAIANSNHEREQIKQDLLKQLILARYFITQEQIMTILLDELEIGEKIDINDVETLSSPLPNGLEEQTFIRLQFLLLLISTTIDQITRHNIATQSRGGADELYGLIHMLGDRSISIEFRVYLVKALAMARYTPLYEQLLRLLINGSFFFDNTPPRNRVEAHIRWHAALALGKLRSPTDEDLRRISEYMQGEHVSQLVQYAIVDILGERGTRGDQQVIEVLQELLKHPNADVLVQWRILNILFLLTPENFEKMSKELCDKLQIHGDMSPARQESRQRVSLGIIALGGEGTLPFIHQRVEKVKDLVMKPEEREEDWEEELVWNLDTIRCIYGEKKDITARSPEQEDQVKKKLEELLDACLEVEVCNHIYETLQKIDRRIRSMRIEAF